MDDVDKIIAQWNNERPDLDVAPMALIGRFARLSHHLADAMNKTFATYGLNSSSFDVLATLKRSGKPYALSPGDLMTTMMITSGTMTNRIDQLEKRNLVQRVSNENDGRSFLVSLTAEGLALIDEAVTAHVATQHKLVASLDPEQRRLFNEQLKSFLQYFEKTTAPDN